MANEKDTSEGREPVTTEPTATEAPSGDKVPPANDSRPGRHRSGGSARNGARSLKRYVN